MERANPYAPPEARVADIAETAPATDAPFFTVGIAKLVVMSVFTLGLYELYWFYKNWKLVKQREASGIWPLPRAIFAVFFCYPLFCRVRDFHVPSAASSHLAAGPLTTGWIVLTVLWRLPDPYWLVSMFAFVFLIPVQKRANEIARAVEPDHHPNTRLTALNWVGLIVGGIILSLAVVGMFLPEEG